MACIYNSGRCPNPPEPGRAMCSDHLAKQREYYQFRRAANIARGKCPVCGKEPPAKGKKHCLYCLGKASEANAIAYPRRAEKAREYARQKRAEHRAAGLCNCGHERAPGRMSCRKCLKRRVRQIAKRRMDRLRHGVCQLCGKNPLLPGLKIGACCQKINPNPKIRTPVKMSRNHPWYRRYLAAMNKARWKRSHSA